MAEHRRVAQHAAALDGAAVAGGDERAIEKGPAADHGDEGFVQVRGMDHPGDRPASSTTAIDTDHQGFSLKKAAVPSIGSTTNSRRFARRAGSSAVSSDSQP